MDERFRQVLTDPRFKTLKKSQRKVPIDGRFKQMFTDRRFKTESDVDPRSGKLRVQDEQPVNDNLKSYYDTSECDLPPASTAKYDVRGGADCKADELSSSSSDESSDEDGGEVDHIWAELDKDARRSSDTSNRLAVCNVNWDRIKVQDLFVLLDSFKPGGASILSVKIYASEFGKKRMAEEAVRGPTEIVNTEVLDEQAEDDVQHEEGDAVEDEYMREKLRQYQLNRLKYYYAIVECDSSSTADSLYDQLDNMEFESSASSLDLRFVPADETFDDEPEQVCTALPDLASYKAPIFITSALQQSSLRLTWDETDPSRAERIESAFTSKDEKQLDDLQAFLASEQSESSDEEADAKPLSADDAPLPDKLDKYKQLLLAVEAENNNHEDGDLEITFDNEDEDSDQESEVSAEKDDDDEDGGGGRSDDLNRESKGPASTVDEEGDAELNLLVDDGKSHFDFGEFVHDASKKKRIRSEVVDDDFVFNEQDQRFANILSSSDYNIDPSNPHFRRTPAMLSLIQHKAQHKTRDAGDEKQTGSAVAGLVAAVKANTRKLAQKRRAH